METEESTEAAPAPAPALEAAAPAPAPEPSFDDVITRSMSSESEDSTAQAPQDQVPATETGTPGQSPQAGDNAPPDETPDAATAASDEEPDDAPEKAKLPEYKPKAPKSKWEHIVERKSKQAERAQQQLADERAQWEQQRQLQEQAVQQFQLRQQQVDAALQSGDVDAALKVAGLGSFGQLSKLHLQKQGALPPPDPRVDALQQQLEQYERREQEQRQQVEQQQLTARQQAEYKEELEAISADLSAHSAPEAKALSKVPGANRHIYQYLTVAQQAGEDLTFDDAAGRVLSDFRGLYKSLSIAFGDQAPQNPEKNPEQTGESSAKRPTKTIRRGGAQPAAKRNDYGNTDDEFARFLSESGVS